MVKKTLLVDMDEVLAAYTEKVVLMLNKEIGYKVDLSTIEGKFLSKVLPDKELDIVSSYPKKEGFFADLSPLPDSREILAELNNHFEIFIVSSATRHPNSLKDKLHWIADNLPFINHRHVIFADDKSMIRGDILVDDQPRHLEKFTGEKLLFSAWHNVNESRFKRANGWKDAYQQLMLLIQN